MKFNLHLLSFIIFILAISGCESDVDINDKWEEVTVVYGMLNPADSIQYIKINKAFLGEGSATVDAAIMDSIYHPDSLEVTLTAWDGNSKKGSYILVQDKTVPKDSGDFSWPLQILYRTTSGTVINADYSYELIIKKIALNEIIASSKTNIVKDFNINNPVTLSNTLIGFADRNGYKTYSVSIQSAVNGRLYEMVLRFNYKEVNLTSGDTSDHFIDWQAFSKIKSSDLDGSSTINKSFDGILFYRYLNSFMEEKSEILRIAGKLDFIFYVGGEELSTYIDIKEAQSGLTTITIKPEYTNIEGGLGVFSSRFQKSVKGKNLTDISVDSLACGSITKNLRFLDHDGKKCN